MRHVGQLAKTCVLPLIGAYFVVLAIIGSVRSYSPVPFGDMWDGYVQFYMAVSTGDWRQWYSLAGPHRIVFSRIFFWLDMHYFRGLSLLLLAVNGALMVVLWAELYCAASVLLRPRKSLLLIVGSLLLIPIFSWLQWENITWGNQTQFFAAYAFPLAALQCLALSIGSTRATAWFLSSLLFGAISTVTMGNGILALPLLIVMVALTRHQVRSRLLVLVPITVAILYFHFQDAASSESPVAKWQDALEFLLAFFGSPFGLIFDSRVLAVIGGMALIGGGAYSVVTWFRSSPKEPMFLALLLFLVYIGLAGAGAAVARAGIGLGTPLSSRYMTTALLGWATLAIMIVARFRDRPELRGAVLILAAVIPVSFLPSQLEAFSGFGPAQARLRLMAALALDLRVRDTEATDIIYPYTEGFERIAASARQQNLSVFGLSALVQARRYPGYSATALGLVPCQGSVDARKPIAKDPAALKVYGWAFDPRNDRVPPLIFLADERGVVIGAAFPGLPKPDLFGTLHDRALSAGFEGYVREANPGEIQVFIAP